MLVWHPRWHALPLTDTRAAVIEKSISRVMSRLLQVYNLVFLAKAFSLVMSFEPPQQPSSGNFKLEHVEKKVWVKSGGTCGEQRSREGGREHEDISQEAAVKPPSSSTWLIHSTCELLFTACRPPHSSSRLLHTDPVPVTGLSSTPQSTTHTTSTPLWVVGFKVCL